MIRSSETIIGDDTGKYQYESPADVDHSKGTLVMATNAEFEPYEYHEGDGIVGIDVDLSRAICDKWDMIWRFWIWNLILFFHPLQQERQISVQPA